MRLLETLREEDHLARLGGDEFTIVTGFMPDKDDAVTIAQKLLDCFTAPFTIGEQQIFAGASIGIAIYQNTVTPPNYCYGMPMPLCIRQNATVKTPSPSTTAT